jgi:RimJ/RimL family protein N-acetyltransferase
MAGSSTAELRLRPTREDDLDFVVAAQADPDNAPFIRNSPRAEHLGWLSDPRHRHVIAEADGRAVGFALLRLHPEDHAVELRRIAVTEKGRGYGRATLELAIRWAFEEHGAHRLWLDVKPHNERARSLYRSAGFVEEGLLRDAFYDGKRFESLVIMSILRPQWTR